MRIYSRFAGAFVLLWVAFSAGCGGAHVATPQTATIQVTSASAAMRAGEAQQFAATVSGGNGGAIIWSVNGEAGGNATAGSIDSAGVYKAPATIPQENVIEIRAAFAGGSASSRVTLLNPVPVIESVSEQAAGSGAWNVSGHSFVPGATVTVDGVTVPATFVSSQSLVASAVISAANKSVEISVANPDPGAANSDLFILISRPTRPLRSGLGISGISPNSVAPGTSVTISGTGFGATQGASTVTFNGTPATPTSWNDTSIVVPVPSGATTGNVVVTVNGVTSNGANFSVAPPGTPSISSLSLPSGPEQMGFVITGTNFGASQGTVTINNAPMTVVPTLWGDTSITVQVPTGATTGTIVVTVNGVAKSNGMPFTVNPAFGCAP